MKPGVIDLVSKHFFYCRGRKAREKARDGVFWNLIKLCSIIGFSSLASFQPAPRKGYLFVFSINVGVLRSYTAYEAFRRDDFLTAFCRPDATKRPSPACRSNQ